MNGFLLALFFFIGILQKATSSHSSIASNEAAYDGSRLALKGNVIIEHPLGTMQANEAYLEKQEDQSDLLRAIHLSESVHIQLTDHGRVHCEKAMFDLSSFIGELEPKEGDKIHYIHFLKNQAPLEIQSLRAVLQFHQEKEETPILQTIHAKGDVEISYGDGFFLCAECAAFEKVEEEAHLLKSMIRAFSPSGAACLLTRGKDRIEAKQFTIYPEETTIAVDHPRGHLPSLTMQGENELFFQCETLFWDQQQQLLKFQDAVEFTEPSLGQICAKNGYAEYEQMGLSSFHLEGDIVLTKNEDRCGIADYLTYLKSTDTLTLTAAPNKRVLLWDRSRGLAISANVVEITRDPSTREEQIKGIGKVRFYFSPSEHALLQKLFPMHAIPEGHDDSTG